MWRGVAWSGQPEEQLPIAPKKLGPRTRYKSVRLVRPEKVPLAMLVSRLLCCSEEETKRSEAGIDAADREHNECRGSESGLGAYNAQATRSPDL